MKTWKRVLKIIFGQATGMQLFLGVLFGCILGFIPGFSYAPFLSVLFIFLVLILNVNIGFVVILFILAKILSFAIEPVSFYFGIWLLDGAFQPIFKSMINMPVLAYAGFDYYLVTGAFVLSVILGVIVGLVVAFMFKSTRNRLAHIQSDKALYQQAVNKWWVKLSTWVILGKSLHKVDWVALKNKRLKHPFRISGVVIVIVIIILAFLMQSMLQSKMVSNILKNELTKVNGSTVDFNHLTISATKGQLSLENLGFSNPDKLDYDQFYAKKLLARVDISALLSKRLVLSNVEVDTVLSNHKRMHPGKLYIKESAQKAKEKPAPTEDQTKEKEVTKQDETRTFEIEKYLKNAKEYRSYLDYANRALQLIGGGESVAKPEDQSANAKTQAQVYGYANVRANYLITKVPTLTIRTLNVKNIQLSDNRHLHLYAENIATEPQLLNVATKVQLTSEANWFEGELIRYPDTQMDNKISFSINKMPVASLLESVNFGSNFSLMAKEADVNAKGSWKVKNGQISIDLPTDIILYKTQVKVNKTPVNINNLPLKVRFLGELSNPSLTLEAGQMNKILKEAGTSAAKDAIQSKLKDKLPFSF
ncbi:TIGR03546 family protein [Fangia hongkongensis]|uniref:TIGR03546 family protein n=2 Tax=Fangia hongkongensis TaxID=270495 RepID=UPI00035CF9C8|nr:TIGR03546 family protein [Fangia hongkongensis]